MKQKKEILESEVLMASKDIFKFIPKERVLYHQHEEKIDLFDSRISVGYKNKNGSYTAYIFSSPIRYKASFVGYEDIDNRLVTVKSKDHKEGYMYRNNKNDILTYYPQKLTENNGVLVESYLHAIKFGFSNINFELTNKKIQSSIWNVKNDTVTYLDNNNIYKLNMYSTSLGVKLEFTIPPNYSEKEIVLWFETPSLSCSLEKGGYILLKESNEVKGIIHAPVIKSIESSEVFLNNKLHLSRANNRYYLSVQLDDKINFYNVENQYVLDVSIEIHRNKQPDSVIYSKRPDTNQYLADFNIIGNQEDIGIGRVYARLRIHEYVSDSIDNIRSVNYAVYNYFGSKDINKLTAHKVDEFWSSTEITWHKLVPYANKISEIAVSKQGYCYFDITEVAKQCLMDDTCSTESNGILLKSSNESDGYNIFASSDSAVFPSFIEINFINLPKSFKI